MRFNRIEGIRDGGNHALTRVNEVWKCAFCGNSCAEAAMIFFASNPCVSRARPLQFIDKEAFAALVTDIQTGAGTKSGGVRQVSVTYLVNDADTADRCIEIAGYRYYEKA